MKKLYSIALAATVTLSASAAVLENAPKTMQFASENAEAIELSSMTKAPAKAAISNMDELIGIYNVSSFSGFASGQQNGVFQIRQSGANTVKILGFAQAYEVEGTVDFAAKTITFPGDQVVGHMDDGEEVLCRHYRWNDNGKGIYACPTQSIVMVLQDDGRITYDNRTAIPGTNQAYGSFDIYFIGTPSSLAENSGYGCVYAPIFTKAADDSADWTTVGDAQFFDMGWVLPQYGFKMETPAALNATYQINKTNANRVRIIDAYKGVNTLLTNYFGEPVNDNLSTLSGSIVFDIADPTCVFTEMNHFCGFQDASEGMYYTYNLESTMIEEGVSMAETIEAIKTFYGAENVSNLDAENGIINVKNCVFGFTGQESRGQAWNEWLKPEYACPEAATIVLPEGWNSAIKGIEADNTNAPVEYFNLQGIRVANPENGVFIRRQGTQVTKVVR